MGGWLLWQLAMCSLAEHSLRDHVILQTVAVNEEVIFQFLPHREESDFGQVDSMLLHLLSWELA